MSGPDITPPAVFPSFQSQMLPNGQPRTLDFSRPGQQMVDSTTMRPPFQQEGYLPPPPVAQFTSAQLPLARITEKSDSVMAHGKSKSALMDI